MSKKKFKVGLESLFGDIGDDQLPGIRPLLSEKEQSNKVDSNRLKRPRKRYSKNFTASLEDLFHNALDKEYTEPIEENPFPKGRDTVVKKRNNRPIIGIDALIRQTSTESTEVEVSGINTPLKKRVTFTLEKQKLEQLKLIAKSKKYYLKDIVDEIISDYLQEYPNYK